MKNSLVAFIFACLTLILPVTAKGVIFEITFFDGIGAEVGKGTYTFDLIPTDTNTPFDNLGGLEWSFDLPSYGINISSIEGDSSSRESTADEGVYITVDGTSLNLRFYDSVGSYISHNDESALPLRTSVRFLENSTVVQYIKEDLTLGTGSFSAVAIPEPLVVAPILGVVGLLVSLRRRRD